MANTFEIECAGYSINADWYEGQKSDRIILILQGFMSSCSRQAEFINSIVNSTGASALVIDYTGHGESPFELKDTRPAQHVIEVVYAFEWLQINHPNSKITVIGNSYGSFLAAHLTHYKNFDTLVLRAPAIYMPGSFFDLWSLRFDDEDAYRHSIQSYRTDSVLLKNNPLLRKENIQFSGKVLVVIHEHDEIIPRQTSDAYIEAYCADSLVAEGFSHAVSQSDISKEQIIDYYKKISDWLNVGYRV